MDRRLENIDRINGRPVSSWHARGWWGRRPLWERVRDTALVEPAKPAIIDGDKIISYGELWRDALKHVAALQAHGAEARDIVLVQLPNWHEFVTLAVAAEVARVVFAFCPIQWGLRETVRALRLIKPKIWFTTRYPRAEEDRAALIQQALREGVGEPIPAVVLARSEGFPKATLLDSWLANAKQILPGRLPAVEAPIRWKSPLRQAQPANPRAFCTSTIQRSRLLIQLFSGKVLVRPTSFIWLSRSGTRSAISMACAVPFRRAARCCCSPDGTHKP